MADLIERDAVDRMLYKYAEIRQEYNDMHDLLMKIPAIENDYEQGFKDGITSECLEELKPFMVELTKGCTEAIKGIAPMLIDKAQLMITTAVNRWISCSERLPEDGELVLIAHVSGSVYIADREGKYWAEDSGEWYDDENVTHWMPLPEPPEKE